jgi:hypothetical protein
MADLPPDHLHASQPSRSDGPTRDVRLPPVPGRPQEAGPAAPDGIADQPTDRLQPLRGPVREPTLTFDPPPAETGRPPSEPPAARMPPPPAPAGSGGRRWPWVLLVLLPLVVIVVSGVWLFVLFRGR